MAGLPVYPALPGLLPTPSWDDVARSTPPGMDRAHFWRLPAARPHPADAAAAPMRYLPDPGLLPFEPPPSSFAGPGLANWAPNLPPTALPVPGRAQISPDNAGWRSLPMNVGSANGELFGVGSAEAAQLPRGSIGSIRQGGTRDLLGLSSSPRPALLPTAYGKSQLLGLTDRRVLMAGYFPRFTSDDVYRKGDNPLNDLYDEVALKRDIKQFRAAAKEVGRRIGRALTKDQEEQLHRHINRDGEIRGYNQIIEEGIHLFGQAGGGGPAGGGRGGPGSGGPPTRGRNAAPPVLPPTGGGLIRRLLPPWWDPLMFY